MPEPRRSTRFRPNAISEKIVPAILILLVVSLLAVLVIVGFSLVK